MRSFIEIFILCVFMMGGAGCEQSASHQQDECDTDEDILEYEAEIESEDPGVDHDMGPDPVCGNGNCEEAEDQYECPADCSAVAVSAGGDHSCVLLTDGRARCWGSNQFGQLGNGTNVDSVVPVAVAGLGGSEAISAGKAHTCALLSDGSAMCWGNNEYGQLGDGTNQDSDIPKVVSRVESAMAISAGNEHTCVLLFDGAAMCWGKNEYGQLGDGSNVNRNLAATVMELRGGVSIAAGDEHTCAIISDGSACCWGNNESGQLGDGTTYNGGSCSMPIVELYGAVAISAGRSGVQILLHHTCALQFNGTAMCWGSDASYMNSLLPMEISVTKNAVGISAGSSYTCAVLSDGNVECWGFNGGGELGDGITDHPDCDFIGRDCSREPVAVTGLTDAVVVSAGGMFTEGGHTCAVLANGTAMCWGRNKSGQLGDGSSHSTCASFGGENPYYDCSYVPVPVAAW